MRDNEEIMNGLRNELKRAVIQRFKRVDSDRFKLELKDHVTHYLFDQTQRSPIIIPVVNVISLKYLRLNDQKSFQFLRRDHQHKGQKYF